MKAIVDEAHRSKIKVAVHASTAEAIGITIEAGVDSVEHGEDASEEQLGTMRDKGIFLGATEWTAQMFFGPYSKIFNISPEQKAGFGAYFRTRSLKSTR